MEDNKRAIDYEDRTKQIQDFVSRVSTIIKDYPDLSETNFGLFLQHGRLGFVDLDAFAKSVDLEKLKQKFAEDQKSVDISEKE